MKFTAIDIETAHGARWSICQIGLVQVNDDKIVNQLSKLVKPPENYYHWFNTHHIHGISSEITENSPSFLELWTEIKPLIENQLVVAHNASFDIDCLVQTLNFYNLDVPNFEVDCTLKRTGVNLNDLCQAMSINLSYHHDAVSDAEACAKIYLKLINGESIDYSKVKIHSKPQLQNRLKGDILRPDLENADKSSTFYNKKIVFTGVLETISREEAANIVKKMGADINVAVSKLTDFIIIGTGPGPSKLKRVEKYNKEGANIQIVDEIKFKEMIKISENK
jgi:DNA polymerase-3 subunit epsilon